MLNAVCYSTIYWFFKKKNSTIYWLTSWTKCSWSPFWPSCDLVYLLLLKLVLIQLLNHTQLELGRPVSDSNSKTLRLRFYCFQIYPGSVYVSDSMGWVGAVWLLSVVFFTKCHLHMWDSFPFLSCCCIWFCNYMVARLMNELAHVWLVKQLLSRDLYRLSLLRNLSQFKAYGPFRLCKGLLTRVAS